ncbi:uncharacterized protein [Haliotis asinina]|uniref:uncharacterized protein n=1 Tax=Haliotis asinina TaxID=109174 RepID=UPI0035318542
MEAPQHCSLLHYPDCQKGCAPGGEPRHSPDLRQEIRRNPIKTFSWPFYGRSSFIITVSCVAQHGDQIGENYQDDCNRSLEQHSFAHHTTLDLTSPSQQAAWAWFRQSAGNAKPCLAKSYFRLNGSDPCDVIVVSCTQLFFCILCLTILDPTGALSVNDNAKYRIITLTGHAIGMLSTNYSMSLIHASSTFAVKMLQPITSAVIQWMIFAVPLSVSTVISLPIIVTGTIIFTGNPLQDAILSQGLIWALISNIALVFRNVALKKLFENGQQLTQRSKHITLISICTSGVGLLILFEFGDTEHFLAVSCAVLSAIANVAYTYLSVSVVLKSVSVITHAILNIMKRAFVVILLCVFAQKHVGVANWAGLAVAAVGVYVYSAEKKPEKIISMDERQGGMYKTAIEILAGVSGLLLLSFTISSCSSFDESSIIQVYNQDIRSHNASAMDYKSTPANAEFLKWRLVDHPTDTDQMSPVMTSRDDVINEAQRIHMNLFKDLIGGCKHAMLFDVADYENKGDPAIAMGEISLLRRLDIQLVYYCVSSKCTAKAIETAFEESKRYTKDDLIILLQGGGNLFSYERADAVRQRVISKFPNHRIILFPQSIWFRFGDTKRHQLASMYNRHGNLTVLVRDRLSLQRATSVFTRANIILAPDMAFQIGPVSRFMPPSFDVLWLRRRDSETTGYDLPDFPANVSVRVSDWLHWPTPRDGSSMETAFHIATNGLLFLQRGRVVITDRLHGHILSILLGIPHVIMDNNYQKVSSYRQTWTRGVEFVKLAKTSYQALDMAMGLLQKYNSTLPDIVGYDIKHN